jgi:hypothetical protein
VSGHNELLGRHSLLTTMLSARLTWRARFSRRSSHPPSAAGEQVVVGAQIVSAMRTEEDVVGGGETRELVHIWTQR